MPLSPERLDQVTLDRLLAHADADEALAELSRHWSRRIAADPRGSSAALSPPERYAQLYCVYMEEIRIGGHYRFLFQPAGDDATATVAAFDAIGLAEMAAVLRAALWPFPSPALTADLAARRKVLGSLTAAGMEELSLLDRAWSAQSLGSEQRVIAYLAARKAELLLTDDP